MADTLGGLAALNSNMATTGSITPTVGSTGFFSPEMLASNAVPTAGTDSFSSSLNLPSNYQEARSAYDAQRPADGVYGQAMTADQFGNMWGSTEANAFNDFYNKNYAPTAMATMNDTTGLTTMNAPITTAADVAKTGLSSLGTTLQPATSSIPGGMDPTKSTEYGLSSWYAPYFTDYLAKQKALSELEYSPYTKELTAGPSDLQSKAFEGIANLTAPERATMTSADVNRYMNPYLESVLNPQLAELQRQNKIAQMGTASKLVGAGAYGGSRQAVMEAEGQRNLMDKINQVTGQAYGNAYQQAVDQYNKDRAYQQGALTQQLGAGETQRGIQQAGLTSDYQQYLRELGYPQEQLDKYGAALKAAPSYSTFASNQYDVAPSMLEQIMTTGGGILDLLGALGKTSTGTGISTLTGGANNLYNYIAKLLGGGSSGGGGFDIEDGSFNDLFGGDGLYDLNDIFNDDFLGYD